MLSDYLLLDPTPPPGGPGIHTAESYSMLYSHPAAGAGNGVKLLTVRPSSRDDVTRPATQTAHAIIPTHSHTAIHETKNGH